MQTAWQPQARQRLPDKGCLTDFIDKLDRKKVVPLLTYLRKSDRVSNGIFLLAHLCRQRRPLEASKRGTICAAQGGGSPTRVRASSGAEGLQLGARVVARGLHARPPTRAPELCRLRRSVTSFRVVRRSLTDSKRVHHGCVRLRAPGTPPRGARGRGCPRAVLSGEGDGHELLGRPGGWSLRSSRPTRIWCFSRQ